MNFVSTSVYASVTVLMMSGFNGDMRLTCFSLSGKASSKTFIFSSPTKRSSGSLLTGYKIRENMQVLPLSNSSPNHDSTETKAQMYKNFHIVLNCYPQER